MSPTLEVPEQGQLVEVRQRRYVVIGVDRSSLSPDPLLRIRAPSQHLISLSSIEDDGLGEELDVIWELEPGARVFDGSGLPRPDGFDDPATLDAFLNAVRWGTVSSADTRTLQAPFRSGIDIEDYQLDPLSRAIRMPRVNLLIADDVGLGKTVEAGLVALELMIRHRARRILVVCPSSLQIQWRDQMREKFGLEFRIVDRDLMRELRRNRGIHVNPWSHFPRLITSIDFLKRDRPQRLFRETLPAPGEPRYPRRYDLLILDEAHNVAPAGRGKYATDSQRTRTIQTLAPHFEHKLFLTATPHNGYRESFTRLLELLDNQRFARGVVPDPDQLNAVMIRRLKEEIPEKVRGTARFAQRKLKALEVDHTEEEKEIHRMLRRYTDSRIKEQGEDGTAFATQFVLMLLKKRLFSSPAAFLKTLRKHRKTLTQQIAGGASPGRGKRRSGPRVGILRKRMSKLEEEADEMEYEEAEADLLESTADTMPPLTPEEETWLDRMESWAQRAVDRTDTKAQVFVAWLRETVRPEGRWNENRVIVFTEYRDTQSWLIEVLATHGLTAGDRVMILNGSIGMDEREVIKAAFQAPPSESEVRILLATDAASEGIDLQRHCSRVVHYEIPWNPNRLEQRNGRVDRHGQNDRYVRIHHFVGKGYSDRSPRVETRHGDLEGDLEFLARAAEKVNTIRQDLGKMGPVIAREVEQAMLGRKATLDLEPEEEKARALRSRLRLEQDIQKRIGELVEQLEETRIELEVSAENVRAVVAMALKLAGQPALKPAHLEGIPEGKLFHLPTMTGSWNLAAEGIDDPHTQKTRPITFDHEVASHRYDVVLVHLNHRLVQMSLRLLRAEIWKPDQTRGLNRVTARKVPRDRLETSAAVAHARLVVIGGDNRRVHEEILAAGGVIREGRFRRFETQGRLNEVIAAMTSEVPPRERVDSILDDWSVVESGLDRALSSRCDERAQSLRKKLSDRAQAEENVIVTVLEELKRAIEKELGDEGYQGLLPTLEIPEREELERNRADLGRRVAEIPGEIEKERALVRARFSGLTFRLFPVTVTVLVPGP